MRARLLICVVLSASFAMACATSSAQREASNKNAAADLLVENGAQDLDRQIAQDPGLINGIIAPPDRVGLPAPRDLACQRASRESALYNAGQKILFSQACEVEEMHPGNGYYDVGVQCGLAYNGMFRVKTRAATFTASNDSQPPLINGIRAPISLQGCNVLAVREFNPNGNHPHPGAVGLPAPGNSGPPGLVGRPAPRGR